MADKLRSRPVEESNCWEMYSCWKVKYFAVLQSQLHEIWGNSVFERIGAFIWFPENKSCPLHKSIILSQKGLKSQKLPTYDTSFSSFNLKLTTDIKNGLPAITCKVYSFYKRLCSWASREKLSWKRRGSVYTVLGSLTLYLSIVVHE